MVESPTNGFVELTEKGIMTHEYDLMNDLIGATKDNGAKIDTLCEKIEIISVQHKDVIRWLLLVVCCIALGSKAMEMASSLWGHKVNSTEWQTK